MKAILPLLAVCGACAGAGYERGAEPSDERTASRPGKYASQLDAPQPDWRKLIASPPVRPKGEMRREGSGPLPHDAKAVGQLWLARLQARDAVGGYGLAGQGADGPIDMFDLRMTAREFDAWVAQNKWSVPRHIDWSFQPEWVAPRMTEAAAAKVRLWPAATMPTGVQHQAALGGFVFLRDGCFWHRDHEGNESLAWFLAESGLDVDAEGYLVLVNRVTGETMARLGQQMTWAGPNADPSPEQTAELRKACGEHPVTNVGNPEASERMMTVYPHLRQPQSPPRKQA